MSLDISNLFGVKGRVAVVTGGSSGVGLMIAKGLVINGCKVYIVALPSEPIGTVVKDLNALASTTENGGSATGYACDLSSKPEITELSSYISKEENGKLDILISNAGIRRDPPIECNVLTADLAELQESMFSRPEEDFSDTFQINTTAHYYLAVSFLPLLAAASQAPLSGCGSEGETGADEGRGVMLITSSCASMHNVTNVDLTSYAASKAATDHLVKLLAAKFGRWYIRVVGINPGFVPSNMNPVGAEGNMFAGLFDKVPAKRPGRAEDLAGTVLYLVSKAGAYVDGISLCVDGGRVLVANGQE
ncbi:SDR family NAD(P)-dependent oxidoreductase [Aspergillus stella-maris]|uniref:SDR family NAD(P)-dependent oxidoreductase n=1 Tax=Aspergillus stella-maris TaxID=1810926 RepID=UPI003CCD5B5C